MAITGFGLEIRMKELILQAKMPVREITRLEILKLIGQGGHWASLFASIQSSRKHKGVDPVDLQIVTGDQLLDQCGIDGVLKLPLKDGTYSKWIGVDFTLNGREVQTKASKLRDPQRVAAFKDLGIHATVVVHVVYKDFTIENPSRETVRSFKKVVGRAMAYAVANGIQGHVVEWDLQRSV